MNKIEIHEVGPRDGFQNIKEYISLKDKKYIIDQLVESGMRHLQITSFVSPKAIPQMKDAKELALYCIEKYSDLDLFALIPNLYGAKLALEVGLKRVSYVVSLSESHNKANIRRTHKQSFDELVKIQKEFPLLRICLDLATAFYCPFEGQKNEEDIISFLKPYIDLGIEEVNLCDTIGMANPIQVKQIISAIQKSYPFLDLSIHIHDTRNMGMVNSLMAIECGIKKIQSTLGGLGGCPFAPGASGNLATEDLIFMLKEMGYKIDINIDKLVKLAKIQSKIIEGAPFSGHLFKIEKR